MKEDNNLYYYNSSIEDHSYVKIIFEIANKNIDLLKIWSKVFSLSGNSTFSSSDLSLALSDKGITSTYLDVGENSVSLFIYGRGGNIGFAVKELIDKMLHPNISSEDFKSIIKDEVQSRKNAKYDHKKIASMIKKYLLYQMDSPYLAALSDTSLLQLTLEDYKLDFKKILGSPRAFLYKGQDELSDAINVFEPILSIPLSASNLADKRNVNLKVVQSQKSIVYFYHIPEMLQSKIYFLNGTHFRYQDSDDEWDNAFLSLQIKVMAQYLGGRFDSLLFRELREKSAYAYRTYVKNDPLIYVDDQFYLEGFVGTQVDKTYDAITRLDEILTDIPVDRNLFEAVLQNIRNQYLANKVNYFTAPKDIYSFDKMHHQRNPDFLIYSYLNLFKLEDFEWYIDDYFRDKKFEYIMIGDESKIDWENLSKKFIIQKLKFEDLTNY